MLDGDGPDAAAVDGPPPAAQRTAPVFPPSRPPPPAPVFPFKLPHKIIYGDVRHARQYDRLVSCQDAAGNLPRALDALGLLDGATVVELGAGTGKLTRLLAARAARVLAFDASAAMLAVAAERLASAGITNVSLGVADHRSLAGAPTGAADVVAAGWSLSYLHSGHWAGDWQAELRAALAECRRVLKPGGAMLILETMGIGSEVPGRTTSTYYAELLAQGFVPTILRTDWAFESAPDGEAMLRCFFGARAAAAFAEGVAAGRPTLPENTCLYVHRSFA